MRYRCEECSFFVHYAFNAKPLALKSASRCKRRDAYAVNDFIFDLIVGVANYFFYQSFLRGQPSCSSFSLFLLQAVPLILYCLFACIWRTPWRTNPASQTLLARTGQKSGRTFSPHEIFATYSDAIHLLTFCSEYSVRSETKLPRWN